MVQNSGLAGAVEIQRRREVFLRLADTHERQSPYRYGPGFFMLPETPRDEWHERMGRKYRRAADRPWLPVAPDPPEPENLQEPERAFSLLPALPALTASEPFESTASESSCRRHP